jgi:ABC-type multidrug transport system ATPase subunit
MVLSQDVSLDMLLNTIVNSPKFPDTYFMKMCYQYHLIFQVLTVPGKLIFLDLMETFTVQEILTFAAKMRLPRSMSDQDKIARVYAVMQELNLTHIKDTKVGGTLMRGISGGEKRRVIVAEELLSSPSILLLDEPTSGLSSTDALNIIKVIKGLSAKGRTVIIVIHQPRSDIYEVRVRTWKP